MNINEKVQVALSKILELFQSGDVPKAISIVTYPPFDVPSNNWSLPNKIIMIMNATSDARGYRMWSDVDRYVVKGSSAFHILAPWLVKPSNADEDPNEAKPVDIRKFLKGFIAIPVFRVEDTDGKTLDYERLNLPSLPLLEVAQSWGIDVTPVAFQGGWYGYYRPDAEEIRLATPEEKTFFHELAHAAHKRVKGNLIPGQDWKQEIVAELSAQTICHVLGANPGATVGNSYEYIEHYARKVNKDVSYACISVLSDVEKVLTEIMNAHIPTAVAQE